MSRYLCYYLQEQGKLIDFYQKFTTNHTADPTGLQSLQDVLGIDNLPQFQDKWEAWVLKLKQ
jgi:hypothetical protein